MYLQRQHSKGTFDFQALERFGGSWAIRHRGVFLYYGAAMGCFQFCQVLVLIVSPKTTVWQTNEFPLPGQLARAGR